jgi:hypothetical protein
MHPSRIERDELISVVGGVLLAIGLFLSWYHLGNQNAFLDAFKGPDQDVTGWQALKIMKYLLLAAAVAPIILTYIVLRGHKLSWPRGEVTAVVAVTALTLVIVRGVIIKPGEPPAQVSLAIGWYVSLLGAFVMLVSAAFHRAKADDGPRKPPGVL